MVTDIFHKSSTNDRGGKMGNILNTAYFCPTFSIIEKEWAKFFRSISWVMVIPFMIQDWLTVKGKKKVVLIVKKKGDILGCLTN